MKTKKIDYQQDYRDSWHHWHDIHKNGCSDPFWTDGANLNLVRNHMLYALNNGAFEPHTMVLPDQVNHDYMADPNCTRLVRIKKPDHSPGTQINIFDL